MLLCAYGSSERWIACGHVRVLPLKGVVTCGRASREARVGIRRGHLRGRPSRHMRAHGVRPHSHPYSISPFMTKTVGFSPISLIGCTDVIPTPTLRGSFKTRYALMVMLIIDRFWTCRGVQAESRSHAQSYFGHGVIPFQASSTVAPRGMAFLLLLLQRARLFRQQPTSSRSTCTSVHSRGVLDQAGGPLQYTSAIKFHVGRPKCKCNRRGRVLIHAVVALQWRGHQGTSGRGHQW